MCRLTYTFLMRVTYGIIGFSNNISAINFIYISLRKRKLSGFCPVLQSTEADNRLEFLDNKSLYEIYQANNKGLISRAVTIHQCIVIVHVTALIVLS